MNADHLLPTPRDVHHTGGTCSFAQFKTCEVSGLSEGTLAEVRALFPSLSIDVSTDISFTARFGAVASTEAPSHAEGYTLQIASDGIGITGADAAGLWYGLQTLNQLVQDHADIPCGTVRDWPALRRRGIHIDLKGYQPTLPRLFEMVRMLASYKINTILLELEDKLAFESAPQVGIDGAYTAEQVRQLSQLCHDLHIDLIPKLQCLGHVDYILQHPRYTHLRENNHPYQFCPSEPGTFDLWQGMAREIMAAFPGHTFFHVGGDETQHLGECDACRRVGKARTYINHVGRCVDFIASQGRTPILWDDILRNLHGHLSEDELHSTWQLGQRAILMYWAYGYGGKDNTFPFIPQYRTRDLRVWGASAYSGAGFGWFQNAPPLRERALNIDAWTAAATEHQLEGVMCTSWTRIVSFYPPTEIPEACWFNMLYAAASTWTGAATDLKTHTASAARRLFGTELPEHAAFLFDLDHPRLPEKLERDDIVRNVDRFDLLCAAMAVSDHEHQRQHGWLNIYEILHAHHGLLGNRATDYALRLFRDRLDRFRQSLQSRSAALRKTLERFYAPATVAEVIQSRFARDHELIEEVERLLQRTRPI